MTQLTQDAGTPVQLTSAGRPPDGLTLDGVTVDYGQTRAVSDVSLHVPAGHTLAIVGPSGCGKSTLLKAIAGLVPTAGGTIMVNGRDLTALEASRRNVGLVPQHYALFPHLNVRANIEYGLKVRGLRPGERRRRVDDLLAFTQLGEFEHRKPAQLSGGQRQRVALARAMAINPDALLLDEPLAALDPQMRSGLRRQLLDLLDEKSRVNVIVTHDQHEALSMSDTVAVMRHGRLVQFGSPREVWERPVNAFVADFLCGATLLDVTLDGDGVHALGGRWHIPYDMFEGPPRAAAPRRHAKMLLRRTSLDISARPSRGSVEAAVTHVEFFGETTLVTLDLAGVAVSVDTSSGAHVGPVAHLTLRKDDAPLLDLEEDE